MKNILTILLFGLSASVSAQKLDTLTVEKIMRDPKWIGVSPSGIRWGDNSKKIYFNWNPDTAFRDELFSITPEDIKPVRVGLDARRVLPANNGTWNKDRTLKLFDKNGDIFLEEVKTGKVRQLTETVEQESDPAFSGDESKVVFKKGDNLFSLGIKSGELEQYN